MSPKRKKRSLDARKTSPQIQPNEGLRSRWRVFVAAGLIVAAGLLAYCNSFTGPFIFDDLASIRENPDIRGLWPIWSAVGGSAKPGATVAGRPVLSFSLALNYQISELEVWSYHAVNLAVHILAALTLFGIVRRTLLSKGLQERFGQVSWALALVCALIWLVHPLQTGSVTYIVQRAESLMGLFYLLSLYCAIRGFSSSNKRWWYAGAITACAFGVGTKEVAATIPLLILIYDRIFVSRSFKEVFAKHRGLYVGLAGTWVIFGALAWTAPRGISVGFDAPNLTAWVYGITQCKVIVLYYLKLSFWPHGLVLDYGWPMNDNIWQVWYYALVLVGLLAGTVVAIYKRPRLGFLGVWFFVILGPSSSFVPILTEVAAEHRMYLPLAAVVVAVVLCGYIMGIALLARLAISDRRRSRLGRALGYSLAGGVVVILGLLSFQRNYDYASAFSIWNDAVNKQGGNWRAWCGRGVIYIQKRQYERAVGYFTQAIKLNPKYTEAYNNRGSAYGMQRDYDLAIRDFSEAIRLNPSFTQAYRNRGVLYRIKGDDESASRDLNKVRELNRHKP